MDNGWDKWQMHVLRELERLEDHQKEMLNTQTKILQEIATIKVKSGFIGALAGAVPGLMVVFSKFFGGS